jgi:predicted O-methyltransferase YrrM
MRIVSLYLWRLFSFLKWYAKAQNAHGLHSPFVFKFYNAVVSKRNYKSQLFPETLQPIESLRNTLNQQSATTIQVTDFGTGGSQNKFRSLTVPTLVTMTTPKLQGWFMYNLIQLLAPKTVLELGTNLGIGTSYFKKALEPNAQIFTVEGCPNITALAYSNFQNLGLNNIHQFTGNLDDLLPQILTKIPAPDFVYFDANHAYTPTIKYFELCLSVKQENTVFLFDDLRYSPQMLAAWHYIQNHPEVQVSIDLFDQGLVLFNKTMSKQKFYLKP